MGRPTGPDRDREARDREILRLALEEELPYDEISSRTGCSPATVSRVVRKHQKATGDTRRYRVSRAARRQRAELGARRSAGALDNVTLFPNRTGDRTAVKTTKPLFTPSPPESSGDSAGATVKLSELLLEELEQQQKAGRAYEWMERRQMLQLVALQQLLEEELAKVRTEGGLAVQFGDGDDALRAKNPRADLLLRLARIVTPPRSKPDSEQPADVSGQLRWIQRLRDTID